MAFGGLEFVSVWGLGIAGLGAFWFRHLGSLNPRSPKTPKLLNPKMALLASHHLTCTFKSLGMCRCGGPPKFQTW